jgi:hypothetical protein
MTDEQLIKFMKGTNELCEGLLTRIERLEAELRQHKAKIVACEMILTKQQTNQNLKRRSNGRRVSKESRGAGRLDHGGESQHPQKA